MVVRDVFLGVTGDDTIYGDTGNDYANGGGDDDQYAFQRGDGSDTIDDELDAATTASSDIQCSLRWTSEPRRLSAPLAVPTGHAPSGFIGRPR